MTGLLESSQSENIDLGREGTWQDQSTSTDQGNRKATQKPLEGEITHEKPILEWADPKTTDE